MENFQKNKEKITNNQVKLTGNPGCTPTFLDKKGNPSTPKFLDKKADPSTPTFLDKKADAYSAKVLKQQSDKGFQCLISGHWFCGSLT